MTVDRRTFLKSAGAGLGALMIAPGLLSRMTSWNTAPTLYGDGIHDDTPGLQALIDGEPVNVRDPAMRFENGVVYLTRGNYRIATGPIRLSSKTGLVPNRRNDVTRGGNEPRVVITNSMFTIDPAVPAGFVVWPT